MLCCLCKKKEATVHLTQIAGEQVQKVDLCDECARNKKVVDDQSAFSLAEMLGLPGLPEPKAPAAARETQCPKCGFSEADLKKSGRLGCARCYDVFYDGLENSLKNMHKGIRHKGKVPAALRGTIDLKEKLVQTQKKLEKAVAEEQYEIAAQLRDEIKALKAKLAEMP